MPICVLWSVHRVHVQSVTVWLPIAGFHGDASRPRFQAERVIRRLFDLDFPAGATPWLTAPESSRPVTRLWKNREGALDLTDLAALLNERTALVQVSLVSFYNGHRIPFAPLRDLIRGLAPQAVIAVDVTQALGRVALDCQDADILISSTHKWTLGIHGGGVIGIPKKSAARLTTSAGGWYHIANAFDADRFESARIKPGALSFSVGMPSFAALYALNSPLPSALTSASWRLLTSNLASRFRL